MFSPLGATPGGPGRAAYPCCGKPIRYTDPETLRLFSLAVHLVGLVDVSKLDTIQPLLRETEEEEST